MALSLTVDYNLRRLAEPGFWQEFKTRDIAAQAVAANAESARGFWRDPATNTLMLMPLQLRPDWINTAGQLDSIIRLSDMTVNSADTTAGRIFESNLFGNASNPWIHHSPASPAALTPLSGITPSIDLVPIEEQSHFPMNLTGTAPGAPKGRRKRKAPGAVSDGRFICGTTATLEANQPLYIRYFWPESKLSHQTAYAFIFAEYCLVLRDTTVEVFEDRSATGDRTTGWQKVAEASLFSPAEVGTQGNTGLFSRHVPGNTSPEYRALFILPYRRSQMLILAEPTGKWLLVTTRRTARRITNPDNTAQTIWDITRRDTLSVWALTPSPGHFQIQKIRWKDGPVVVRLPHITLDYTPAVAPSVLVFRDQDRGTTVTATLTDPPGYTLPVNNLDQCPAPTTDASAVTRTYGVTLTFDTPADQRWTPFFYGIRIQANRQFADALTTASTVLDTESDNPRLLKASITVGDRPGEGKMEATVADLNPFPFAPYYYRSRYHLRLADFTAPTTFAPHFVGIAEPNAVEPLRYDSDAPRLVEIRAADLWKRLNETYLRDQRDYGPTEEQPNGWGHITVVKFVAEQAGIDVTGADIPTHTDPVDSGWNTPLGGVRSIGQEAGDLNPGWQPKLKDTAASFILRIAELYSGWRVGFHANGQFFYQPRDRHTTPVVHMYPDEVTRAAAVAGGATTGPLYRSPASFRTIHPQANVVQVVAGRDTDGEVQYSALWVDWASILNPAAQNFVGDWLPTVVEVGGTFSCGELNRMARIVWQEARRRVRRIEVRGEYVQGLQIGRVIRFFGYGDYRLINYSADFMTLNDHAAVYEGELLEAGYGV